MSTQVSSLSGGGVKRVIRGIYAGQVRAGGIITLPSVNSNKTMVNMNTSAFYGSNMSNNGDGYGGWASSIYCELKSSTELLVSNRVDMYIHSSTNPIHVRYVKVVWEVIEYV
ncbi:hypothetical protein [Pseudoalteromonas sp. MMG012]|uniref:hypothetical protein n=1 Tax=Pseudoalteromonas sp. MMG012 TaxID=2822686 RepID=UPI001B3A455E|nr:hypothetical protein [Pseudoalteromonas sp. MMG012]MBQ4850997.1 hypothetical protein [Pseudoalteromonas sp. MMG012]